MREELIKIKTDGEEYIALWKIDDETSDSNKNIFLVHGTFSNRKVCMGITEFLVNNGYTCWIMECRNHGASSPTKHQFNFESIGLEDVPLVFEYLFNEVKVKRLSCVTHSGGGIYLTLFLIANQDYLSKINRIVFFGCQAFGAAYNYKNYLKIYFGNLLSSLLGYIPAKRIGRPHNETHYFMKQWANWNLSGQFLGKNGIDYKEHMPLIQIPILSICAKGDTFVAPKIGCEQYLNAFQNSNNKLLFCAKETGFREDYDHNRILYSSSAKEEIYPKVLEWIT